MTSVKGTMFSPDQEKNYLTLHQILKKALKNLGISSEFVSTKAEPAEPARESDRISCVKTLFSHDLFSNGKKIAGSSQRKRGETILLQGTIHLDLKDRPCDEITKAFIRTFKDLFDTEIVPQDVTRDESTEAQHLAKFKYDTPAWNQKY